MIINVLKDGTVVPDLTGHVVQMDQAIEAYEVIGGTDGGERDNHPGRVQGTG